MRIIDRPLVFVDVETNGLSHTRGKIIEVAALRVENGEITATLNQLVDPETDIPPFISQLTGITAQDLLSAPVFSEIADELYEILDGAIFVAHNVRFDYAFIKQEFKRVNRKFNPKLLCTVRLSRTLYPEHKSHKLQAVIERCGIQTLNRHRAYDDALATRHFFQHIEDRFDTDIVDAAMKQQLRTPSLPKALSPDVIESLPEEPGVYMFKDDEGGPLYIGKSVNIRKRVLSHFSRDHEAENEFKIAQHISQVDYHTTGGELEALLLESRMIKELQPLYNRMLRRTQKLTLARQVVDDAGYIRISIEDVASINPKDTSDILAVYTTKGKARKYLDCAVSEYLLCPKLLGFERGPGSCFLYQLKKCDGACVGIESPEKYNLRLLGYFDKKRIEHWPYKSAIAIKESSDDNAKSIIVDQWCVIADVSVQEECTPTIKYYEKAFDIDTYNILRSFIRDKTKYLNIQPVSLDKLGQTSQLVTV